MSAVLEDEIPCGSLRWRSPKFCAERVLFAIKQYPTGRAVCVDPVGRITVEDPNAACEDDLLGVFVPALPMMELYRTLRDELATEAANRGWWGRAR